MRVDAFTQVPVIDFPDSLHLSARYMLEGKDAQGNACRIFIENQGNGETGLHPKIVTDSPLLKEWEECRLSSTVEGAPGGVTVRIFRETEQEGTPGRKSAQLNGKENGYAVY